MKTMAVDWSSLPADAVEAISTKVSNDADYVRFRSVCTSWRSAAPRRYPQLPWLVVVHPAADGPLDNDDEDNGDGIRTRDPFFELCNFPNTTDFLRPPQLPDEGIIRDKFICGSSRGWIAILDDAPGISLYNPFTGLQVRLPLLTEMPPTNDGLLLSKSDQGFSIGIGNNPMPFTIFRELFPDKLVLSSDPATAPEDCVVMALFNNRERLIHCRPGETSWTPLSPGTVLTQSHRIGRPPKLFQDIIFFKGQFYAVYNLRVFVCDTGPDAQFHEILPASPLFPDGQPIRYERGRRSYLVVSSGDLLLVLIQDTYHEGHSIYSCEVFRVDLDDAKLRLVKMESLGGRSLFIGDISMSLSTESPVWCKGNCIYSSYKQQYYSSIRIFSMEDGSTSSITSLSNHFSGLHWLTPSLC